MIINSVLVQSAPETYTRARQDMYYIFEKRPASLLERIESNLKAIRN